MGLPVSASQAKKVFQWMNTFFGPEIEKAVEGTPFKSVHLIAIICQETAYVFSQWIDKKTPQEILKLCVFDASGDAPDAPRSAFPKNTFAFRERYGSKFTSMLIDEANRTRAARGWGPKQWVYKGYGIFQYDLQFVIEDEKFFREKLWYNFSDCLARVMGELKYKYSVKKELWATFKAYNGSGPRATAYANNVAEYVKILSS